MNEITITVDGVALKGLLSLPRQGCGMVVFAHGSGSSRLSSRNNFVADVIRQRGPGTLLFDLLTEEEDRNYDNRFDIPLLTQRLMDVTRWLQDQPGMRQAAIGYFGASTGAAAALKAAARLGDEVVTVVSRGGRPDLAGDDELAQVRCPVLLIVGGYDGTVIDLNEHARAMMRCERTLTIIPGATHLFEEPGTLEQVAELAANWFSRYLAESLSPAPIRRPA